jgi:sirohydrochlorin ferrochelatase
MQSSRTALVLIDHGSRVADANHMLEQLADRLRRRGTWPIVEPAHMELAQPDLAAAFASCVAQGATRVIVVPYFLAPGNHASKDIPALAADAATAHPGVAWSVAAPLGMDDRLLDVVETRAGEAAQSG